MLVEELMHETAAEMGYERLQACCTRSELTFQHEIISGPLGFHGLILASKA